MVEAQKSKKKGFEKLFEKSEQINKTGQAKRSISETLLAV